MQWLFTLFYGLVSGLAEFLPVSSQAHQTVAAQLFGMNEKRPLLQFVIHLACLIAVLVCCGGELGRIRRAERASRTLRCRGSGQMDEQGIMTGRLLKAAGIPLLLGLLFYRQTAALSSSLPAVAAFLVINGIGLLIPGYSRCGNKDARALSAMDGVLIGLSGALSVFPGISRVGSCLYAGASRGTDRSFAFNFAMLLSVPALIVMLIFDFIGLFYGLEAVSFLTVIQYLLTMCMTFIGSYFAVYAMRSLALKTGFTSFAYYSWGLALFTIILYLTT